MEQSKKITVSIPSNDRWVVENLVDRFKKSYQIEISIDKEEDREGVNFFVIASCQLTHDLIFEMGYYYSGYVDILRQKGKIDW